MFNKINVLKVGVTNANEDDILKYLYKGLNSSSKKQFIVTLNPEILVYSYHHPHYRKVLNEANIALPDGVGVFLAAGLSGNTLKQRITGVDFMEEICKRAKDCPISVGFLGGRDGVAERTAECLMKKYPWIDVRFVGEEWGTSSKFKVQSSKFEMDFLFVAFGHPKQEEWIYENLDRLPVKVAMGVGGAFDYVSGNVVRAPILIRALGFEWLFRLIVQPWRWRRQLTLPEFAWLTLKEIFSSKS